MSGVEQLTFPGFVSVALLDVESRGILREYVSIVIPFPEAKELRALRLPQASARFLVNVSVRS